MEPATSTLLIVITIAILVPFLTLTSLIYKPLFEDGCGQDGNPWQQFWGESYGPELKQRLLGPVFGQLEGEGKISTIGEIQDNNPAARFSEEQKII